MPLSDTRPVQETSLFTEEMQALGGNHHLSVASGLKEWEAKELLLMNGVTENLEDETGNVKRMLSSSNGESFILYITFDGEKDLSSRCWRGMFKAPRYTTSERHQSCQGCTAIISYLSVAVLIAILRGGVDRKE